MHIDLALIINKGTLLNVCKTGFIWLGTCQQLRKNSIRTLTVGGVDVDPVTKARCLGSYLMESSLWLSMSTVSSVAVSTSVGIFDASDIAIPTETRRALVTSFIASRLDNCNAILYVGNAVTLHRLQMVLNAAARLVAGL